LQKIRNFPKKALQKNAKGVIIAMIKDIVYIFYKIKEA